jgi:PAS domain S-box-containing protein
MKLQTQFSLAFLPILLLSGLGATHLAGRAVHSAILEEVASRGRAHLDGIAGSTVAGLETGDETQLLPILTASLEKEGAVYVMALNDQGRIIAHTNVVETGKMYPEVAGQEIARSGGTSYRETMLSGQKILEVAKPVWSHSYGAGTTTEELLLGVAAKSPRKNRVGTLRIGYPLEQAMLTEAKISRRLALLLLCSSGLLLGSALLLMGNVLLPVGRLIKATEAIGGGVYGATIPIPSASELAALARSFNRMSDALSQTTVSKDFLDSILKNVLDPLIVLEPTGEIRMINRAALETLGYAMGELLGLPAARLCDSADTLLKEMHEGHEAIKDRELQFITKTGLAIDVLFSGASFQDKDGGLVGFIIVAKDIRERKKLERDMRQSEKLSAVGRLASGVAHEINNPLGVILGFAEGALVDMKPEDPLQLPLKSIEREAIRCKNLVQDLLTFSRVSKSGREPIDINKAIDGAFSLILAQARLGRIKVVKELAPGLPHILGNVNQIQQVIINLANNALDAMHEQGTLTVKTSHFVEGHRSWVSFSIADTGSGIPKEILPRIFEPFFTTKGVGQGTGLGLGLVHEIVQKHSGTITVETRPGFTEFLVKFPAPETEGSATRAR